jgi:peptidoglycan hydrolase-like protein with peptidoglycan-binding domain
MLMVLITAALLGACISNKPEVSAAPPVAEAEVQVQVVVAPAANAPAQLEQEGQLPDVSVAPVERYDSENVIWIQRRLSELGYYDGVVDGSVGRGTRGAIREYQSDQGLEPDGLPTAEFREFMWRNGG